MKRDILIALSLANLCFLKGWSSISRGYDYFQKYYFSSNAYLALTIDVLLLAFLFLTVRTIVRKISNAFLDKILKSLFLIICLIPLNALRISSEISVAKLVSYLGSNGIFLFFCILLAVVVFSLVRWHKKIVRIVVVVVLIMTPLVIITFSNTILAVIKSDALQIPDKTSLGLLPEIKSPRVLWLIFDEMDQRIAFTQRPNTLELPEFDRLRNSSFFALNAYPPAGETVLSMPSLIIGDFVTKVHFQSDELLLDLRNEEKNVKWSTRPNIFTKAHDLGYNSALVGWAHPYGRVIGDSLASCNWYEVGRQTNERNTKMLTLSLRSWKYFLSSIPVIGVPMERLLQLSILETPETHAKLYFDYMEDTKNVITDPGYGLVFIHLPIPHAPNIYDRANKEFLVKQDSSYLDNLALADRTFGEIRRKMEEAGTWDNTIVVVSADHWWRANEYKPISSPLPMAQEDIIIANGQKEHRIPFMIKMANQKEGLTYNGVFNTVVSKDLILDMIRGKVSSPSDIEKWIELNHNSE